MSKAIKAIEYLIDLFAKLAALLVLILSFLVVYDSISRYFFDGGSVALQELEWHLFDIIFLLGLSYTLKSDKHVRVDIFYTHFTQQTKAIVNIIAQLFLVLPFVLLVLYVSYDYIALSYGQNEISADPGGLCCRYLIKSMMMVGFFLLGIQSFAEVAKNITKLKAGT
ncbi:MAG: TRAP transporter small permease subunit [Epsilonproteobacteria bacterium]|nr:TRAP transporter small permease subunit [Campylobacterota bacterium]